MSETDDDKRKRRWLEIQNELNPDETEISRTLSNIATVRAGWFRVRNEAGAFAYFPDVTRFPSGSQEQRALEDAWESRAAQMHRAQTPLHLKPKPTENTLASRVVRAD